MKAIILAGGLGTRISEETDNKPKPMIEIGSMPILWHLMKIYSFYGINDFIICCGYKGHIIKEFFNNYILHQSEVTFDLKRQKISIAKKTKEPWKVTLVDTGENTMTGGRLRRVKKYLKDEKAFCFTYGDGLANINISNLIAFHFKHQKLATLTAVRPQARFGHINFDKSNKVTSFKEKPKGDQTWINGGFFVLHPKVIDLIDDDNTSWENEPLNILAAKEELYAYNHDDFWMPMDTLRDKKILNSMWLSEKAPWKLWQ